jgi:hypothetical protein
MAGSPFKRRVLAALQTRAERYCGDAASIIEYVCCLITAGYCMREVADLVASDVGHPVSRSFLSWTLSRVAGDAKARLQAARDDARPTTQSMAGAGRTDPHDEWARSPDEGKPNTLVA